MKILNNDKLAQKRGVALVTVLLIMMIATIATTAIYKWLSRMGYFSSAELKRSEAYQAAQAGVESVRSWFESHADDAGGVLTAYYYNNPNREPMLLDTVLEKFPAGNQKNFSAYLVGADIRSYPYKLKVLVTGTSRDSSKYSQIAVMNVNGLYRDSIPTSTKSAPFSEGFLGSVAPQISFDVDAAIINGNADFNTEVKVANYLVVTGTLNVNSSTTVKDLYVKGALQSCTGLHVTNNTYVEGQLLANGNNDFDGDLYVQNGIDLTGGAKPGFHCNTGAGGYLKVGRNLSVFGDLELPSHTAAYKFDVYGNTIVGDNHKVNFVKQGTETRTNQIFRMALNGHVFLSGGFNDGSHIYYTVADSIRLGGDLNDTVYIQPGASGTDLYRVSDANANLVYAHWKNHGISTPTAGKIQYENEWGGTSELSSPLKRDTYCNKTNCAPASNMGVQFKYKDDLFALKADGSYNQTPNEIFVQVNGQYLNSASLIDSTEWIAERMEEFADRITNKQSGSACDTINHVDDPIQFDKSIADPRVNTALHTKSSPKHCDANIWNDWSDNWKRINDCYAAAQSHGELYKNKWLTLSVDDPQWVNNNSVKMTGKFIIIVNGKGKAGLYLPKMNHDTSMVFMYFADGYDQIISTSGNSENSGYPSNYFIYSEENLANMQFSSRTLNGSVFLRNCHQAGATNAMKIRYNDDLVSALALSGVVCANDGTDQCSDAPTSSSSSGGSGSDEDFRGHYENLFIPSSPRLKVTIESIYKNDEKIDSTYIKVPPSIVVMPRVIRLPGGVDMGSLTLADFYQPRVLNDTARNVVKTVDGSASCAVGIPGTGPLGTLVSKGVHKCTFTPTSPTVKAKYGISRFYVDVGDYVMPGERPSSAAESSSSHHSTSSPSSSSDASTPEPVSSSSDVSASCYWKTVDDSENLTSQVVKPGEVVTYDIDLKGKSSAYVSLVREPNVSIDSWTLVDTTRTVSFEAPTSDGTYEYVLYENNKELCRDTLEVVGNAPEACTENCHCTCGKTCDNIQVGDNVGLYNARNKSDVCVFGTSVTSLKAHACGDEIVINGFKVDQKKSCTSEATCASLLSNIPKIDGGYYMMLPGDNHRKTGTVTGATSNPCKCGNDACGCTCSDCNNVIVGNNVGINDGAAGSTMCLFGTSINELELDGPCATDVYINGQKIHYNKSKLTCNSQSSCESVLGNLSSVNRHYQNIGKIDGGYYIEVPKSKYDRTVLVSGATKNPCGEKCACTSYCKEGCENLIVGDNVGIDSNVTGVPLCVFGTSISEFKYDDHCGANVFINGTEITSNKAECHGTANCASTAPFSGIPKVDGGYYMYIPVDKVDPRTAKVTGATSKPSLCGEEKCHCTCSGTLCDNVEVGNNIGITNQKTTTARCLFGTSINSFKYDDHTRENFIINGVLIRNLAKVRDARTCSGATDCASKFSDISKLDGGYYVEIPADNNDPATITVSGATKSPCTGSGIVTITSKNVETDVPCGKMVVVSTNSYQYNSTFLHCSGSFSKKLGSNSADQYNDVNAKVCDSYQNTSSTSCSGSFATECNAGYSMTCKVQQDW